MGVSYSDAFKRQLKRLARHNRHIRADIQPVIEQLEAGETPGDQIRGLDYRIYKVRVRNTGSKRGKRGGYRIIYWLREDDDLLLVTVYSKTEQADITAEALRRIVGEGEA